MARSGQVIDLGLTDYREALTLQRRLHAMRVAGQIEDVLLLTEHERVITLGRNADGRNIRVPPGVLADRGIDVIQVERGGDVTYHGPGQLVAYPILDLRSAGIGVREYVRRLEQTAIALMDRYGIRAQRRPDARGVWVGQRKLASAGVYISRWIAMHGIAINIEPELADFELIHPCGLVGVQMTSVAALTGRAPTMADAAGEYARAFGDVFDVRLSALALLPGERGLVPAPSAPAGLGSA